MGDFMRKKILVTVLVATMAVILSACGGKTDSDENKTNSEPNTTDNIEDKDVLTKETSLANLEEYLLSEGVLTGERTETSASMVGAVSGFKYVDSGVEFYEYDETSDAYKKLAAGEAIELEGMPGFTVSATAINGKYVLMTSNDASVDQKLIDTFNSYK